MVGIRNSAQQTGAGVPLFLINLIKCGRGLVHITSWIYVNLRFDEICEQWIHFI